MIPAPFDYRIAESVEHAASLLRETGEEARLIAGGHSLLPLMRLRLARPGLLIDIGRLEELSYVRESNGGIAIGALTRHRRLETDPLLADACPLLARTAAQVGDPQVRHRGTIGGSLAHGDPASDLPTALLALDAELVASGADGDRVIPAAEFFIGPFMTALAHDEVLTEIRVPRLGAEVGCAYLKFNRRAQDWAIVGVAAVVERSGGSIERAAIGLTNMGATPLRAAVVEEALSGADSGSVAAAAQHAAEGTDAPADTQASAEYREHLARVLVERAVTVALDG